MNNFKLCLEFEEVDSDNRDLTNEFANVIVTLITMKTDSIYSQ